MFTATVFTVDPALSSISLSATVGNALMVPQDAHRRSLTTAYHGTIIADLSDGAIRFTDGTQLVASESGTWKPGSSPVADPDNANATEPADYGGQFTPDGLNYLYLALRGVDLDLTSPAVALSATGNFDASGVTVTPTAGTGYYDGLLSGESDLSGISAVNQANSAAAYSVTDGVPTLTLPIEAAVDIPLRSFVINLHLVFTGQVIARAEPSDQPVITAASYDLARSPQDLSFQFDRPITTDSGAMQLQNLTTGENVSVSGYSFDSGSNTATFQLPGVLADGNYRATFSAGDVSDAAGRHPASDFNYTFYFLGGDVNQDRSVNFSDLLVLAQNYGKTSVGYQQGDVNFDGRVDFNDLLLLAQTYRRTLPPGPHEPGYVPLPYVAAAKSSGAPASVPDAELLTNLLRRTHRRTVNHLSK